MFGKKKSAGKTVAIVDIENGSVAAALVRLSPSEAPRLFAETRVALPLLATHNVNVLARQTEDALEKALAEVSGVAARMRANNPESGIADVSRVAGFFSLPWANLSPHGGPPEIVPHMASALRSTAHATLGHQPMSIHSFGTAALHGTSALFPYDTPAILCIVSGEATELLVLADNTLKARATLPIGLHTFLRTLVAHGGVSAAEARSYITLGSAMPQGLGESLQHAQAHFAREFMDVAQDLLKVATVHSVLVAAPGRAEEWFARALGEETSLTNIFPEGSTVRALRAGHVQPYLSGHGPRPDLPLMLEALFVDKKYSRSA